MPEPEPHKQPPHEKLYTKTCPSCGKEVLVLIHEFKDGKVVRTFCHLCPEQKTYNGMELVR
jgi:hypothetical protein